MSHISQKQSLYKSRIIYLLVTIIPNTKAYWRSQYIKLNINQMML